MKKQIFILLFFISHATYAFYIQDSATIILKNVSHFKFTQYIAAIKGQTIGGENLKSGDSTKFKIPLSGTDVYRFTIYLDKKHSDKYSVEPMDYYELVSQMNISKGTYTYYIDIKKKDGSLSIKLIKTD